MQKEALEQVARQAAAERGCFLVDVELRPGNEVEVVIEKTCGAVDWEDCAALDKAIHEQFSQDEEDYALTVSSAGLDRPFRVPEQFSKAVDTPVDVKCKGGRRLKGTLRAFDGESVTLEHTARQAVEGKKKKVEVTLRERIPMEDINSVSPWVELDS